jgi:hypothetical protein
MGKLVDLRRRRQNVWQCVTGARCTGRYKALELTDDGRGGRGRRGEAGGGLTKARAVVARAHRASEGG